MIEQRQPHFNKQMRLDYLSSRRAPEHLIRRLKENNGHIPHGDMKLTRLLSACLVAEVNSQRHSPTNSVPDQTYQ